MVRGDSIDSIGMLDGAECVKVQWGDLLVIRTLNIGDIGNDAQEDMLWTDMSLATAISNQPSSAANVTLGEMVKRPGSPA